MARLLALAAAATAVANGHVVAKPPVDFARVVAPILEQRCIRCHQPGNKKSGISLATFDDLKKNEYVVAGDPDASYLVELVAATSEKPRMPKEGPPLTPEEVANLREWIREGARWPGGLVIKERAKADRNWWSLKPLAIRDAPLSGIPAEWRENPIDRFVYARLAESHLQPNLQTDRQTLLRRVTYDLTGLPPTAAESKAFVNDPSPNAYEKLVDRLLTSPRYGEQWGRHWLDVVRFGESTGYEINHLIDNAWPFRDYVIRSFNEDKPFDRFITEHLAGDAVGAGDPAAEMGLTFLVCGPVDIVGNKDPVQAAQIRADAVDEIIRATGEAFLGLTVGCARCHDHKFDPISQRDYYSLYATFAGVYHAESERPGRKVMDQSPQSAKAQNEHLWHFEQPDGRQCVFERGDAQRKGEPVLPSSLSTLADIAKGYALSANAMEQERRKALTRWLVAADNPLTPRVLMNRVWQFHFGTGIVATPSDFGYMGERPSHPELLDWLASRLVAEGWHLKKLHKLIVTSQTYRQSSAYREDGAKTDADSRLLWRFPPRRLSAEEIRDTMLFVAGKLNERMGGPGFRLYQYSRDNVATYTPLETVGPETYRRAVYHQNARASRVDLLSDFDAPDCVFSASRRVSTTTPSQALALLNHSFTLTIADALSNRIKVEDGANAQSEQIKKAFMLVLGRQPNSAEQSTATMLVGKHGLRALCRALLNSSEMIYVN
jgi:mono/diheme cytochrome c family protein